MKGRPPKSPERRQGHRTRSAIALLNAKLPAPRETWLKSTREDWVTYWESEIARATRKPHLNAVRRLFDRYDERERAHRAACKHGRLVTGSQGQPVLNPLVRYIAMNDVEIRQLEDRLGLTPRSMAQLGANFAQAQKSLDELNRSTDTDDTADASDADPRLEVVQ